METLGQFLKREREFRGISLERLAGMTRINSGVLKKIEEDDFGRTTQAIYVRSFLKSYAGQLGIDASEVLRRYEGQAGVKGGKDDFAPPSAVVPPASDVNRLRGNFGFLWVAVALVVVSLIVVATHLSRR